MMEYIDNIPIYLQIKDILYRKIISNQYELGSQLPSVRQLAVQFSANSNTVQKSLKEMTEEDVVIPQRGKGNFVTEDTGIVEKLKTHIVTEMFDATYDKLHSLNMNDTEIMNSFNNYVKQREVNHEQGIGN
ncbi:GntR family transcriptional regulator [Companilactobacillus huachuanensis]|uniref:GntR family transcriptional regulator n=1 Tax=Companilactobacillus huachuanensis TaxID=2559914 RepID=A0ABW1RL37_9LACO|nr:GntR family transcriptional regulator [Companilactobacillus huachuanensis]